MDISKRDELYEEQKRTHKKIQEGLGRIMGFTSAPSVGKLTGRHGTIASKNAGEVNGKKLAGEQGVSNFTGAFKEEDGLDDVAVDDEMAPPADDALDVPVDANADMVDDGAQDLDGASEKKMAADAVAQAYLSQLPSDVALDADEQGIVFAEFHDDHHGPFKVLLFPADMGISDVADVKEPAMDDSPLDAEEPVDDMGGEELPPGADLGGEELPPEGGEMDLGGDEEEELTEVELVKGAKDGIEKPDQVNFPHGDDKLHTVKMEEEEEVVEEDEEKIEETCGEDHDDEEVMEEETVIKESARDRRLRKKGLIGNDRNADEEAAKFEQTRDPMRQGRKDWQNMMESRRSNK